MHEGDRRHHDFVAGADLLIHDAQYTSGEYALKRTWGHSPVEYAVDLAIAAGVRRLALFHHDPEHDDDFLDRLLESCRERVARAGSTMQVFLAREGMTLVADDFAHPAPQPAIHDGSLDGSATVLHPLALVVEDDADVRRLIEQTLKRDGWLVETAGSSEEAWQTLRHQRPSLVLLDLTLPGTGGFDFLRTLRGSADREQRSLPVVVLTACATEADIARCFAAGATDHIAKPFAPAQLRARVKGWLHRSEAV
jgi:CheY-like chemotaxis protein